MGSVASDDPGRTRKSARNALVGLVTQFVTLALGFVSRTIFVAVLGTEMLGVNAVYTSILSVLSLAELGFTSAFAYALYAPLRENDWSRVGGLLRVYRKVFRYIAGIVAGAGLASIPLLPLILDADVPFQDLVLYYCLFLGNSVVTYLFADRVAVITADQRLYLVQATRFLVDLARVGLQVAVLLLWHSFAGYLIVQLVCGIVTNLLLARKARALYPSAFDGPEELDDSSRREILTNVKGTAIYKVSGVALHSSTTVIISMLLGTLQAGFYANHALIVGAITMVMDVVFNAANASVGNLTSSEDRAQAMRVLNESTMLTFLLHAVVGVVLLVGLDDLVELWLGPEFRLGMPAVVAMVLNLYVYGMTRPTALFREAAGLFVKARFVLLATAVLSLVIAVLLGNWIGLPGILIAYPAARLLTQSWMEPRILLKNFFGTGPWKLLGWQLALSILAAIAAALSWALTRALPEGSVGTFVAECCVALGVSVLIFGFILGRTDSLRGLVERAKWLIAAGNR